MMNFDVITLFPAMFDAIKQEGIIARAMEKNIIRMRLWQLRDFSDNKYRCIDDKPYGGGAGMVMQVKPIRTCINNIKAKQSDTKVIYLSPQGKPLTQKLVQDLAKLSAITLLCGRYQGVDERVIEHDIDLEVSLGDFILSGGEIAAMALIDSIGRQLPDVLGNEDSKCESFSNNLLSPPLYTRPQIIDGQQVPKVLLSGDAKKISAYNQQQSLKNTQKKRPKMVNFNIEN